MKKLVVVKYDILMLSIRMRLMTNCVESFEQNICNQWKLKLCFGHRFCRLLFETTRIVKKQI